MSCMRFRLERIAAAGDALLSLELKDARTF
jgi:hypothetical protein